MIRFSNRVKYGIRFLLFLSVDEEGYTGIMRAAISCQIPQKFLEAIAVDLKKGNILEVKRGAGGGYRLVKSPKDIRIADIVKILDPIEAKSFSNDRDLIEKVVDESVGIILDDIWHVLEGVTLDSIQHNYLNSADKLMYYI